MDRSNNADSTLTDTVAKSLVLVVLLRGRLGQVASSTHHMKFLRGLNPIVVAVAGLACASAQPLSPTDRVRAPATIEQVDINVAESFPPQYFVGIVSLQPNSCATFDALETTREGSSIQISVWNLVPADPNVICAAVVSSTEHNVALGTDFKPGQSYDLQVNDVTRTFIAQ